MAYPCGGRGVLTQPHANRITTPHTERDMKTTTKIIAGAAFALAGSLSPAYAEDCVFEKPADEFEQADTDKLYSCIKDALAEGYAKQGDEIGSTYRTWGATATAPAAPGPHGSRFLFTFANEVALDEYIQYRDEGGFEMPVGSVLAKESFSLHKKGKKKGQPRKGPLFIMTKVAAGVADETDAWVYSALQPNGKVMKIKQSFCHDCHAAYEDQDSMGYPDTDVRFESN